MIRSFHKTLCLLSFLLYASCSYSQDYIYKHYDLQDGLPNSTIHCIFQDRDGFLWVGTESGLCRYDGTSFKTFTVKEGLPGNDVFGIFQDSRGRLWLQLYKNSIAYIWHDKIYSPANDPLLKDIKLATRVYGVTEYGEGNIAFCDNEAVYIISKENRLTKCIGSINGRSVNALGLFTSNDKELFLCTGADLYKIKDCTPQFIRNLTKQGKWGPTEVALHPNYIVVGSSGVRTIYLKDTSIRITPAVNALKYSLISDSVFSMNTIDGAYLFNINNYQLLKILPGVKVSNIFMDREKNLWIGTLSRGLYRISSQAIVNRRINDNKNDVYYIAKEREKIIVGNNSLSVYEYYNNGFVNMNIPGRDGLYDQKIFYYEKVKRSASFVANGQGLMICKNGTIKNERPLIMIKQVRPIDKDHVLTAAHTGLFVVKKDNLEITDTVWRRKSLSALIKGDSLLVGTLEGLFILKENKGRYVVVDSLLRSSIIGSINESGNHLIWVCTYENGLYCMKDGKIIRHFADSSGLPSNNTRCAYTCNNNLWIGTDKGLVKIMADGRDFHIQKYSTSDGLPSNTINSVFADGNMIYIGTPEGLCYFDERQVETGSMCNIVLTGIRIGDSLVDLSNKYSLGRSQRLVVEYSGISFRSEKEMTYRYRLNGIDNDWRYTKLNSLEFTALPYGDYELEVVAINKMEKESLPLKIPLHIARPFYTTDWFMILMVLFPLSVALFYYTRRMSIIKQKQMQKLEQEIRILQLEQTALRLQMNPHFIFNCITTIQQLVAEKDTRNSQAFITSFSGLVRQTLDNAPELFIPLSEEIKFLTNYFELERIRLEDLFSYAIHTTGITDAGEVNVPNMIIQPFVENAIRHGIRYKKNGKGHIEVKFVQQDELLRCLITDNGVGRERAWQIREELNTQHDPKGTDITFKRIGSLNTLTQGSISISIEDMKDENDNASGTKVIIDFYKMNYYGKNSSNR